MNRRSNHFTADFRTAVCRRFFLKTLPATIPGTVMRYLSAIPLVRANVNLSILTFTIYPDLCRLWYACLRKSVGWNIPVVIVDSCGSLKKTMFPGASVTRFINRYHSWKAQRFISRWALSRYLWLMDDDRFILDPRAFSFIADELKNGASAVSLLPRRGWSFTINGKQIQPLGSFNVAFDRALFIREKLTLEPKPDNPFRPGKGYDTMDWANHQLLIKGCRLISRNEPEWSTGFYGTSYGRIFAAMLKPEMLEALLHSQTEVPRRVIEDITITLHAAYVVSHTYRDVFREEPVVPPLLSEEKMRALIADSPHWNEQEKNNFMIRMDGYTRIGNRIREYITGSNP